MNHKKKNPRSLGIVSKSFGGGGCSQQIIENGKQMTEEKPMLDSNMITLKTEESDTGDFILNSHPSQIISKLNKLNQKNSVVEEENINISNELDQSEIIKIDSDFLPSQVQKPTAKQINTVENIGEKKQQVNDKIDQQSYQPSDNIEFHSLASIEKFEEIQKQKTFTQLKSMNDQGITMGTTNAVNSHKTIKASDSQYNKSKGNIQIGQSIRYPNKSFTAIEQSTPSKNKLDLVNGKVIRQIRTQVEDDDKKKSILNNKMTTSIMDSKMIENDIQSQNLEQLKQIAMRRGGSGVDNINGVGMNRQQKRKTFLNGPTSKIKNFFSRTFTETNTSVLVLLLNAWRFISSLKRVSSIWRPDQVSSKQIDLIDDSSHFENETQGNRKRKKLFGSGYSIKEQYYKQNTSIQSRKKNSQESQLMKWMLKTLKFIPIIKPQSQYLYVWDTIHSMFIILNLLIQPIEFVTNTHMEQVYSNFFWIIFPYICFSIFIADILINFNTGLYLRGICITDRKQVMTNYFKKGFIWDLLALLPVVDSLAQFESGWRIVNVFVVCKYITLRRMLGKYLELFQLQNDLFIPTFIKLLKVGFLVLFQAHLFACLFLGLAKLEKSYELTDVTWIEHYSNQQQAYLSDESKLTNETVFSQYIYAFYWSVTTMTTTGYGDISASNNYEATFTAFSMIIAGGVFAYSFNSIGFIVTDLNKKNSEFQKDMSLISKYLKNINIKRSLQIEVTKYIEYKHRAEAELSTKEEKEVLEKLGPHIRDKITISANIQFIKQVPFLSNNFSPQFLRRLALHMNKETYLNNEIIFEENDQNAAYHHNLSGQFNHLQQQQQLILNPQYYQQQYFQSQNQIMTQPFQQQQYLNLNINPINQQNIMNSQSIQLPYPPQYNHQLQAIQNQVQNQTQQYPQINSLQSIPTMIHTQQGNHTRKLSGNQQVPNLVNNFINNNANPNINTPLTQNTNNLNQINQTHPRQSICQFPPFNQNTIQSQQININAGSNNDQNNQNPQNIVTNVYSNPQNTGTAQLPNLLNNNHIEDYFYAQSLQQSQSDISFYIIERGTIQLFTKCYKYINEDETIKPIKELRKGDLFGELSFFTENPRCASARSIGPSSVLSIKKRDFIKLLKEFPSDYEIYCQIHDEITINKNIDTLQIRCYSCDKVGHIALHCNRVHFQPDQEKVILTHNFKESKQFKRSKDVWRRVSKYKCLEKIKDITLAQKKIENQLQNQSQLSSQPLQTQQQQQQQQQQTFTTYFNNQSNLPQTFSFNPLNNRQNQKKLTLRQLQTLQTQFVDQEYLFPPSPPTLPNNNFGFTFQNLNNNITNFPNTLTSLHQNQGQIQQQQQPNHQIINPQTTNQHKSSLSEIQMDNENILLRTPPQLNVYSSFQSRVRGSNQKDLIIFEDDNETPIEQESNSDKQIKFISPTTVDTMAAINPSSNSIAVSSNPHHKKSIEDNQNSEQQNNQSTTMFNNVINTNNQLNTNQLNPNQLDQKLIHERRRSNRQSVSFGGQELISEIMQPKILDKPPQLSKALIKDIAAELDDQNKSFSSSSNEEENNDIENKSDSGEIQMNRQRSYKPILCKQKSFTAETTPQNKKIFKKINEIYQNYNLPSRNSHFFQKSLLFQHIQNTLLQNLDTPEDGIIDLDQGCCEDFDNENNMQQSRKTTNKFLNQQKIRAAKKEMIFEFPSLNTDRMKNFKSYFTYYNCSAVLERLSLYRPSAYHKRNRLYHIYNRDTLKKLFQNNQSKQNVTPVNSRISGPITKIANMIINSNMKDKNSKKPSSNTKIPNQLLNKKLSMVQSQQKNMNKISQNNILSSNQFKLRTATVFQEDSDDEF